MGVGIEMGVAVTGGQVISVIVRPGIYVAVSVGVNVGVSVSTA